MRSGPAQLIFSALAGPSTAEAMLEIYRRGSIEAVFVTGMADHGDRCRFFGSAPAAVDGGHDGAISSGMDGTAGRASVCEPSFFKGEAWVALLLINESRTPICTSRRTETTPTNWSTDGGRPIRSCRCGGLTISVIAPPAFNRVR